MKTLNKVRTSFGIKSVIFVLLLSWLTVLSSCLVGFHSPRYDSRGVIVERHGRSERQGRGEHQSRGKHNNQGDRNNHGERNN
jgi:hypothetical protein